MSERMFIYLVWIQDDAGNRHELEFGQATDARLYYETIVAKLKAEEAVLTRIYSGPCQLPAVGFTVRLNLAEASGGEAN